MRYWLFSLAIMLFIVAFSEAQDAKTKGKDVGKKTSDPSGEKAPPKEITEYGGKSFEQWLKELQATDPARREVAMKTILLFGAERAYKAVPIIIADLKRHPFTPVDLSVRVNGTFALGTILQNSENPDPKHIKDTLAIFRTFLKDDQVVLRVRAVQALPYLGPDSRAAMPEVLKMVRDPLTWEARQAAIQTLQFLVAYDPNKAPSLEALSQLMKSLDDVSILVRHAALRTIGAVGYNAKDAEKRTMIAKLNNLITYPKDNDAGFIMRVHATIMYVKGSITKDHVDPIVKMLKSKDKTNRMNAVQVLAELGPDASRFATPTLLTTIHDEDAVLAITAMEALINLRAESAIPELRKITVDPRSPKEVKKAAQIASDQIRHNIKMEQETKAKLDKKLERPK